MNLLPLLVAFWASMPQAAASDSSDVESNQDAAATVLIAVGAPGTPEYGQAFTEWAERWKQAATQGHAHVATVGLEPEAATSDYDRLHALLAGSFPHDETELWLVLIGHGTFDGRSARFNLRGPDISAKDLSDWLTSLDRPIAVINCASSSGPFVNKLSAPNRVIVSATKSGYEQNYARFGDFLSQAIADPAADLDKDGQTSLLESFLKASRRTAEFYELEGRLATEHALLDDNGDGRGTRADWFRGLHPVRVPAKGASIDGLRAHQWHLVRSREETQLTPATRRQRDALELQIFQLRQRKNDLSEDTYYDQLEHLLIQLARLYNSGE